MASIYLPILVLIAMAVLMAAGFLFASWVLGRVRASRTQLMPYECGLDPMDEPFRRVSIRYYVVALRVVRFDVAQESADPSRFVLIEVYRGPEGAAAHKQTEHYQAGRDSVAAMMAEPRTNKSYATVTPAVTWALDARV